MAVEIRRGIVQFKCDKCGDVSGVLHATPTHPGFACSCGGRKSVMQRERRKPDPRLRIKTIDNPVVDGKVKIRALEGHLDVPCFGTEAGLAVTKNEHDTGYAVTQLVTGLAVVREIPTVEKARDVLARLAPLTDWSRKLTKADKRELEPRVRASLSAPPALAA